MSETTFNSDLRKPVSIFNYAYKWALIGSVIYILKLYGMMLYNDNHYNPQAGGFIGGLIDILLVIATMYMCTAEYRKKELEDYMTFGKAFKVSYITGILFALFLAAFMYYFHVYQVDYDLVMSEQTDLAIKLLKEKGLTQEQINKQLSLRPEMSKTPEFASAALAISGFTLYALFALIVAAILKRNPPTH